MGAFNVAIPISGDRISTQRDVNSSQTGAGQQADRAPTTPENIHKPVPQDSLELKSSFQENQPRPLSDAVQDAAQAQDKLAGLLGAMRDNPAGALAAQGGLGQGEVDALLSHPV